MNVKLHTPSTLKSGSGLTSGKQFLLSLLATSISIILTFGTAGIIDYRKKQASKKEMVMMVISDMDKTIEHLMKTDTVLSEASRLQQELAVHPEYYDSLRFKFMPVMDLFYDEFSETVEKIFTSNIETFNTIGDTNFINEASLFYILRRKYKETVVDELRKTTMGNEETGISNSLNVLFHVNFPEISYINWSFLSSLKESRDKCMQMMKISEKDLKSFSEKHIIEYVNPELDSLDVIRNEEFLKGEELYYQALDKYKD